ncbi:MAG TPA: penicillin acylase family protein [Bryobacteraceae bacterium]|jgi:penicillin amidase|nr:penicillin acylase family protein [Bryobacteraceae bacterium]
MRNFLGLLCAVLAVSPAPAAVPITKIEVAGLRQPVEILRDRWGVPHIYAQNTEDLFFAQGYITATDRLFQLDLWRRIGTGKLSEVLGPPALARDRIARLVRYRGDWGREWDSYSPDTKQIATAFTAGINAYIHSLHGKRPPEFDLLNFDPGLWVPEDVTARVAGLLMTGNALSEVARTLDFARLGGAAMQRFFPPEPFIRLELPKGLDASTIRAAIARDYIEAIGPIHFPGEQGSNNWVVDGALSRTGKPLLANDPHRPVQVPSLRKTVHLVAPGWDVIGAGEPALPGVALGHNENIAFGFTIVGIDQQDIYVEKLNPDRPDEYRYRGEWRKLTVEHASIPVRNEAARLVDLKYTIHGPVIYEDGARHLAYALKWVGEQPGGAGYLSALSLARARNWHEFKSSVAAYKVPSENLVYADKAGNIGWIAAGLAPVRKNWSGLFPVPGDSGAYEWSGYLNLDQHPIEFNPARHFIATANHDILPPHYEHALSYYWAPPSRYQRVAEVLSSGRKFDIEDFIRLQQDTVSIPARHFIEFLRGWKPKPGSESERIQKQFLGWDANVSAGSETALIYEFWMERLESKLVPAAAGARAAPSVVLRELARNAKSSALLSESLEEALAGIRERLGNDPKDWQWGAIHKVYFPHPSGHQSWNLPAVSRPGDGYTVNATSGAHFLQQNGASYRQIIDVSNWDRSVMTNVPGESGVPGNPHYGDLVDGWANGHYHPIPFTRTAVEAAAEERIVLEP